MPRNCTICAHPQQDAINSEIVQKRGNRRIATQFSVTESAVRRHTKAHLPDLLAKGRKAEQAAEADRLLWDMRRLQQHTLRILLDAEKPDEDGESDPNLLLKAVAEARRNTELMLKAQGDLNDSPTVNINLHTSSEWLDLEARIVKALEPHPQARESVLRAIESVR